MDLKYKVGDKVILSLIEESPFHNQPGEIVNIVRGSAYPYDVFTKDKSDTFNSTLACSDNELLPHYKEKEWI